MIIGITGNIGSGKSKAAAYLAKKGAYLIDADQVAREVVSPNRPAWRKLKETFGEAYFEANGELNRRKLAGLVFNDKNALKKLNSITHPAIIERCLELAGIYLKSNPDGVVVLEAALLIEADMLGLVDCLWLVVATKKVRLKRIMARDKLSVTEATARIESQMPERIKRSYANYIVDNNSDEKTLFKNLDRAWEIIHVKGV